MAVGEAGRGAVASGRGIGGTGVVQSHQMVVPEPINESPKRCEDGRSSSNGEIAGLRGCHAERGAEADATDPPTPIVFDRAQLMARAMGDAELVAVVIDGFLGDFPRQLEIFKGKLDHGDAEGVKRGLHNMKGVASTVAALELQQWVARMEATAKAEDMSAVKRALPGLEDRLARLGTEMRK